jgi:hypothetical protein
MKARMKWIPSVPGLMIFLLLLFLASCTQPVAEKKPIEGAWKMIYFKNISDGEVLFEYPGTIEGESVKIWTGGHFSFVGQLTMDTVIFNNYGTGTYEIEGISYIEYVHFQNGNYVENTINMKLEISNDTLTQSYPVDENGEIDPDNISVEKYIRLD